MILRTPHLALLLALLALGACRSTAARGPIYVHPTYGPLVDAISDAFEDDELELARRSLGRLGARLAADRAAAEAATPDAPLAPGRPDLAAVLSSQAAAEGLERILEARLVLAELSSRLVLRRVPGEQAVEVLLECTSTLEREVVLRPGPASLEVRRLSLEPRQGHEQRASDVLPVPERFELAVPAGDTASRSIARIPIIVPAGAIATRTTCALLLRAGSIVDGGRELPAQILPVANAERTDLPSWLPSAAVEPDELARQAWDLTAGPASLAERAVRILPERRGEALDGLVGPVMARTDEELAPLVPVIRWLSGTDAFGRHPQECRAFMEAASWRAPRPGASD